MIIKRGSLFWVLSLERDKIVGGPYRTRAEALKVLNSKVLDLEDDA